MPLEIPDGGHWKFRRRIFTSEIGKICLHWAQRRCLKREVVMPLYRDPDATGRADEITVIEDPGMVEDDGSGGLRPTFAFVDRLTVRAHPVIIDSLLRHAERLWSLDELLTDLRGE